MDKNPYILLAERIKKLVPDSKIKEGMGAENAYDEFWWDWKDDKIEMR